MADCYGDQSRVFFFLRSINQESWALGLVRKVISCNVENAIAYKYSLCLKLFLHGADANNLAF